MVLYKLFQHIKKRLRPGANFKIVGYSFGAIVTLEVVRRLESEGRQGSVWLVDGAPDFLQGLAKKTMPIEDEKEGFAALQIKLLQRFLDLIWPQETNKVNWCNLHSLSYNCKLWKIEANPVFK